MIPAAAVVVILAAGPGVWQDSCAAPPTAPALDHVVIVARDLDAAAARFAGHGFRIKQGRLHANGLLNRHVKFPDGSGIELMTVVGPPGDSMAADYAELLRAGEGGVYVALTVSSLAVPRQAAGALALPARTSSSGAWSFLSFPSPSPAAAVFFSTGRAAVQDADSVLAHVPPVRSLLEAWVEGGAELEALLARTGARSCGTAVGPAGRTGTRWALARGSLVVLSPSPGVRPRVRGAVLSADAAPDDTILVHPDFWLQYR